MCAEYRRLSYFTCEHCGDRGVSEITEAEAMEEARELFGVAVDKYPEKFITVCEECFELMIDDAIEACRTYEAQQKKRAN